MVELLWALALERLGIRRAKRTPRMAMTMRSSITVNAVLNCNLFLTAFRHLRGAQLTVKPNNSGHRPGATCVRPARGRLLMLVPKTVAARRPISATGTRNLVLELPPARKVQSGRNRSKLRVPVRSMELLALIF